MARAVKLTAQLSTGPSCAMLGGGRVLCAARGTNGGLVSSVYNGSAWSKIDSQDATSTTAPNCTSDDNGRVVCVMLNTASSIIANRYNADEWDGFIDLGGRGSGAPTCSDFGVNNQVVCYARGTGSSLFGNLYNGGAWSASQWGGWSNLGGLISSQASCAAYGTKLLICGTIEIPDSALYFDQFNGSTWLGFAKLGQTAVGNPSCIPLGGGKVLCAITGVDSKVRSIVGP